MKEMASTMNFLVTKGISRLKHIVWNIPCCKCDSSAGERMTVSLLACNLFLRAKEKLPQNSLPLV